jgi:hypothetical protein
MIVYISHSRQNAAIANRLSDALAEKGLKPWLDSRDLDESGDWNHQVAAAIRKADAIVFLIGPPGPDDRFQRFEWEQAVDEEVYLDDTKALIPVIIGEPEIPGFLSIRRAIRITPSPIDFPSLADSIVEAVNNPAQTVDQQELERGRQARDRALKNLRDYSEQMKEQEAKRAGLRALK